MPRAFGRYTLEREYRERIALFGLPRPLLPTAPAAVAGAASSAPATPPPPRPEQPAAAGCDDPPTSAPPLP